MLNPQLKKRIKEKGFVDFSDRYISILSGTTRQGNSLKSPLRAVENEGLIPKSMLPVNKNMDWDDYHNREDITWEMRNLGKEFRKRFSINYERVYEPQFSDLLAQDLLDVAVYAWIKDGKEYVNPGYPPNHAIMVYNKPDFKAYDNYKDGGRFTKQLVSDYDFMDYGYRVFISLKKNNMNVIKNVVNILFNYIKQLFSSLSTEEKKEIISEIDTHLALIKDSMPKKEETNQQKLLRLAKENLGRDVTPQDKIPDEVACAETVSALIKKIDATFPIIPGTWTLDDFLKRSNKFHPTLDLEPGNILISPTGTGNGTIRGHVGIILEDSLVASNNSYTGKLDDQFSIDLWVKRYRRRGGFPLFVYKML